MSRARPTTDLEHDDRAVLARPPEKVLELLYPAETVLDALPPRLLVT